MSPRRLLIALGLASGALVATGAAMLPWPVGTPTAAAFVSRGLREYGLSLTAEGPATMTLLPLPRLAFARTRVSTAAPGGPALIEGGGLAIELNPLALLTGRPDIGSLALTGATIHLPRGADDPHWAEPLRRVAGRIAGDGSNHPRRVILTDVTLDAEDGAQDLDLTLAWPIWSGTAEAAASLTWRGARTDLTLAGIRVADILNRRDSPFSLTAAWPAGTLAAAGTASFADGLAKGLALSGRGRLQTRSLPETLAWVGGEVALAPFIRAFSLDGRFETAGRRISLPSVRATLGDDVLDGAGSVSLGEARTSVQATLAAESLNLAPLLAGLVGMFGAEGDGAARPVALAPLTGGDLDLRISAAGSRIGPVMLEDLAASVLVREGAVEVALGRAAVQGGTLKGRVTLTASGEDGGETEVKAQGVLDRLDLGALVADLGEARWLLGGTQGQFALESRGRDAAALTARVAGRAAFVIDGGMITGLDLADVMHRNGAVAPGALARRNARTPFERAALSLTFADGIGEIGEGTLKGTALTGSLRGQVSLPDRSVRARAEIGPKAAGTEASRPGIAFDIAGPWDAVAVRPAQAAPGDEPPAPFRTPTSIDRTGTARAYAP